MRIRAEEGHKWVSEIKRDGGTGGREGGRQNRCIEIMEEKRKHYNKEERRKSSKKKWWRDEDTEKQDGLRQGGKG